MANTPTMDYSLTSHGFRLSAHLATPPSPDGPGPGVVLCHGFPVRGRESPASGKSFPELADRIATEMGWTALTINFRGCGQSEGDFSMSGWRDDIHAAVQHLLGLGVSGVWLAGYGSGGALCISEGARNPDVRGVAAIAAPADFDDWARHPRRLVEHARQVGVIKTPGFPVLFDSWAAEFRQFTAVAAAAKLAPRPLLIMHGESDDLVPSLDARVLADAHGSAELRIIGGGGHELRHDPRAVAVLLGWLSREHNASVRAD
ncbi:MAG: alpha/beta fold hydrolase [Acidimicrobiales bacterium]